MTEYESFERYVVLSASIIIATAAGYIAYHIAFRHLAPGRLWFVLNLCLTATVAILCPYVYRVAVEYRNLRWKE